MSARIFVATITTPHFSFVALGETDVKARKALMGGWGLHRQEHEGADPDYVQLGDISVIELGLGECCRDSDVIEGSKAEEKAPLQNEEPDVPEGWGFDGIPSRMPIPAGFRVLTQLNVGTPDGKWAAMSCLTGAAPGQGGLYCFYDQHGGGQGFMVSKEELQCMLRHTADKLDRLP